MDRIAELGEWSSCDGVIRLGACMTYARIIDELGGVLPGLAMASRLVGSPQIRRRGTIGGSLGSAASTGDVHPPLLAAGAMVEVASVRGVRHVPVADFYVADRRNVLARDELIAAVLLPVPTGPELFTKVGRRSSIAVAVASFAIRLDPVNRRVGTGFGAAAPTPRSASAAEESLVGRLAAGDMWERPRDLDSTLLHRFGEMVAEAASPADDVRGTAEYRRLALAVLAKRSLLTAWASYQGGRRCA